MILMYHKIDIITPTIWWVSPRDFRRHLSELMKYEFVNLSNYKSPENEIVITFDDAYENVYRHAFPILKEFGISFEVFVIGSAIGDWNDFDPSEPRTRHMNIDQLEEMAASGGRIQWHSHTHPKLPDLSDPKLDFELEIPTELRNRFPSPHFSWFCYPGGSHDDRTVDLVRRKFSGAVSVINGKADDRWQLNRVPVDRFTSFLSENPRMTTCGHW